MARREERAAPAPRRCRLLDDGGAVSVIAGQGEAGGSVEGTEAAAAPGVRGVAGAMSGDIGGEGCGVL